MWTLRLFFLFCLPSSIWGAATEIPRFETDPSSLKCTVNNITYSAEKFNPTNSVHWAAALKFEVEENPHVLVVTTPFVKKRKPLGFYEIETPFGEYVFFQNDVPIGIFELSNPYNNEQTRKLENLWWEEMVSEGVATAYEKAKAEKPSLHSETKDYLEAKKSTFKYDSDLEEEMRVEIFRYITRAARGEGAGKIVLSIMCKIVNTLIGKSCPVAVFRDGTYVQEWSSLAIAGYKSYIEWSNLPSLASHVSLDSCGVVALNGYRPEGPSKGMFAFFYPPMEMCTSTDLALAKTIVAMEKAAKERDAHEAYLKAAHAGAYGWL